MFLKARQYKKETSKINFSKQLCAFLLSGADDSNFWDIYEFPYPKTDNN